MHASNQTGFTLIETLVSLFILSIAITGAFAVISYNVSSASFIKNGFVASGLAQEGLELARNLRDNDWFANRPFGVLGGASPANGLYCVQWDSSQLMGSCANINPLKQDPATGLYSHNGTGAPTIFSRTLTVTPVSAAELKVVVDVSWKERVGIKHVYGEEHLFNWY